MTDSNHLKREPSFASRVTAAMLAPIESGKVKAGQPLLKERELSDQFGVSRTVVRETILGLETKDVLEVLSGRGVRGPAVPAPNVLRAPDLYTRGRQSQNFISAGGINEIRETLELKLVAPACERTTANDLKELERSHLEMSAADSPLLVGQCDAEVSPEYRPQPVQRNLADHPEARYKSSLERHGQPPRGLQTLLRRGGIPK